MCLSSEKLKMKFWPEYNTYVGSGYKLLRDDYPQFDVWQEATGWEKRVHCKKTGITLDGPFDNKYHAGFHIFLNVDDAINYSKASYESTNYNVYNVDFTDVIGFGKQRTNDGEKDCVITRWMYVYEEPASVYQQVVKVSRPDGYLAGCTCSNCTEYTKYLLNKTNV
jgi:hypothetical protein